MTGKEVKDCLLTVGFILVFSIIICGSAVLGYTVSNKLNKFKITKPEIVVQNPIKETTRPIIVDEDSLIKNMVSFFKSLPKEKRYEVNFSLSYFEERDRYLVSLDYKNIRYSSWFDTYEKMIDFVSDPQQYYYSILPPLYTKE
jgi:hypothetical protein